jgi:hypothetical protein
MGRSTKNSLVLIRYLPLLTALFFSGCKEQITPSEILPPKKFARVLVELSLVEAAEQQKALPELYLNQPEVWTVDVFSRLNTDSAEFNRSFRFYFTHPEAMKIALIEADLIWNKQ